MTDATLTSIRAGLAPDPLISGLVGLTDKQLNSSLAPILRQSFPDYDPASPAKGRQ